MASRGRLLKHIVPLLFVVLAVAFLLPEPCYSAEIYFPEAEERAVAYGIQVGEMLADLVAVEAMSFEAAALNSRAKNMAAWKHENYDQDHRTARPGRIYVEELTAKKYISEFVTAGGSNTAYRTITASGSTHSKLYEARVDSWKSRMNKILDGNKYAADDVVLRQEGINSIMNSARNVAGYTRRADEAAYLEVLLNDEINKLNTDVDRRLTLETEIALNEQLERSDAIAAYSLAVGAWNPQGSGVGY